jgi:uncharacterized damage-inducible protein DinB
MATTAYLRRTHAYDVWANQQLLECLGGVPLIHDLLGSWSHLVLVRQLWLRRVLNEDYNKLNLWTVLTIQESADLLRDTDRRWGVYLNEIQEKDLDQTVRFTNTQGKPQEDPLRDVLMHLSIHTSHLRGQLCVKVRATGIQPPTLDPILWARDHRHGSAGHHKTDA